MNNEKLEQEFRAHITSVIKKYEDIEFPVWFEIYKYYNLFNGDIKAKLKKYDMGWREASQFPLIKQIVDTVFANVYDTDFQFIVLPRTKNDVEKAEKYQYLVNWIFDVSQVRYEFFKAIKEAILLGVGFVKVGVEEKNEKVEFFDGEKVRNYTYTTFNPKVKSISPFSLFIDPAAKSVDEARYIFERKMLPKKNVLKEYDWIKISKRKLKKIIENPQYFSTTNYEKIYEIHHLSDYLADVIVKTSKNVDNINFANYYQLLPQENDIIEVVEYYTYDELYVFFNGYIVYKGKTIYPLKGYPYIAINYEIGNTIYTKGVGTNLLQFQKAASLIFNSNLDLIKIAVSPMFEVNMQTAQLDGVGDYFNYEPYKIIRKRGEGEALKPVMIIEPNAIGLNLVDKLINYIELSEGPNQYTLGGTPVERSATGANLKANILKQRLKPLLDNVNEALTKVVQKIALILINNLNKKTLARLEVRVIDKTGHPMFTTIKPEDIIGQYDVVLELNSLKTNYMEHQKQQILEFLQLLRSGIDIDPVNQTLLLDRKKLLAQVLKIFNLPLDLINEQQPVNIVDIMQAQAEQQMQNPEQNTQKQQQNNENENKRIIID